MKSLILVVNLSQVLVASVVGIPCRYISCRNDWIFYNNIPVNLDESLSPILTYLTIWTFLLLPQRYVNYTD